MGARLALAVGAVSSAYHPHRDRLHLDDLEDEGSCCMHPFMEEWFISMEIDSVLTIPTHLFLPTAL